MPLQTSTASENSRATQKYHDPLHDGFTALRNALLTSDTNGQLPTLLALRKLRREHRLAVKKAQEHSGKNPTFDGLMATMGTLRQLDGVADGSGRVGPNVNELPASYFVTGMEKFSDPRIQRTLGAMQAERLIAFAEARIAYSERLRDPATANEYHSHDISHYRSRLGYGYARVILNAGQDMLLSMASGKEAFSEEAQRSLVRALTSRPKVQAFLERTVADSSAREHIEAFMQPVYQSLGNARDGVGRVL